MHEARLDVGADQYAEPDEVDAELLRDRRKQRNDDESDLEEVEEERYYKDEDIHEDQEAKLPAGQRREQVLNPLLAADPLEHQAEHARADQDEDDHGREAHGGRHTLIQELPVEGAVRGSKRDCAHHSHGSRLGWGGEPHEDRAEHEKDQSERRDHAAQAFFPERPAVQSASLEWQRWHGLRPDQADDADPGAEQSHLDQARPDGARVHVADRAPEHIGEHDENQGRRDQLSDSARRRDDAHRVPRRIAVPEHWRHRDHAHGDHRSRYRAGDGAENGAYEDHGIGHAATHRAEQLSNRIEQVLGQTAALEDRAHEREERDRQQQVVRDDAEQLIGEVAEKVRRDEPASRCR